MPQVWGPMQGGEEPQGLQWETQEVKEQVPELETVERKEQEPMLEQWEMQGR